MYDSLCNEPIDFANQVTIYSEDSSDFPIKISKDNYIIEGTDVDIEVSLSNEELYQYVILYIKEETQVDQQQDKENKLRRAQCDSI